MEYFCTQEIGSGNPKMSWRGVCEFLQFLLFLFQKKPLVQIKYSWIFQCRGKGRERKMSMFAMLKLTLSGSAKDKNSKAWTLTWSFKENNPNVEISVFLRYYPWSLPASPLQRGSHLPWQKRSAVARFWVPLSAVSSKETHSNLLWPCSSRLRQQRSSWGGFAGLLQPTNHSTRLAHLGKGWHTHLLVLPLVLELPCFIFWGEPFLK